MSLALWPIAKITASVSILVFGQIIAFIFPFSISKSVALVLNSYRGQDFGTIPFASIRIYEGTPTNVKEVFAKYDIANDKSFHGNVSMVMGVFYLRNGEWKFNAIGESTDDRDLKGTLSTVVSKYL